MRIRNYLIIGPAIGFSACVSANIRVTTPPANAAVPCSSPPSQCSVSIHIDWTGGQISGPPTLALDGVSVPNALAFPAGGLPGAAGTLTMAPGSHSITVWASLTDGASIKTYSASSSFTVVIAPPPGPGPGTVTLALVPSTLLAERGKTGITQLTVTRGAGFTGAVTASASPLPAGVTITPLTIPATATTGDLKFNVSATAAFQQAMVNVGVTGPGGSPASSGIPLTLTIPRAAGSFSEASPMPYTNGNAGLTVNSLSGTFAVDIKTGAQAGLPQPLAAQFRKGTTAVGSAIGFTRGPQTNLGGAGFCRDNNSAQPSLTRGVVLTSSPVGSSAQNVFSFIDLIGNPAVIRQIDANASKANPAVVAQPKVYFSPDCTLALVTGVNTLGPSSFSLTVQDLQTGNQLAGSCGWPISFNSAGAFSALIKATGAVTQLEVKVDGGAPVGQTCTYTVP